MVTTTHSAEPKTPADAAPVVLTEAEAARVLRCSQATLARLAKSGRVRYRLVGQRRRYTPADLADLLEEASA